MRKSGIAAAEPVFNGLAGEALLLFRGWQPVTGVAGHGGEELEEGQMLAQNPVMAVANHRVEVTEEIQHLARVLAHPEPGPHFQGEGQKGVIRLLFLGVVVQVIPEIPVGGVVNRLRLDQVGMVIRVGLLEDLFEPVYLGNMRDRPMASCVATPDPVPTAKAAVAIQAHGEW